MIINATLANHQVITQALGRLTQAFIRHNNPYHEPVNSDLLDMFEDLDARNVESDISAISKLNDSGDLAKVSDELYDPSSTLFDSPGYTAYFADVELPPDAQSSIDFAGDDNISCASCYLIRVGDDIVTLIKNYHTLTVIDFSQTSWNYPVLLVESLSSFPQLFGGRLGSPTTIEALDVSPSFYSASYPFEYIYTSKTTPTEALDSAASLYSVTYPTSVLYATASIPAESLDSTPYIYSMVYPLTVGYITYTTQMEAMDSTGHLYAISFS